MKPQDRSIALFGYEAYGGRESILWKDPSYFSEPTGQSGKMLDEAMGEWRASKRDLTRDEALDGHWVKISETGQAFIVKCNPDGTLTECSLFDPGKKWDGNWSMPGPVLRLNIGKYELDVVASREGSIHSGLEFASGGFEPQSYFKVLHVR